MRKILLLALSIITLNGFSQNLPELYKKVNSSIVVIETMSSASIGGGDKKKVNTVGGQGSGVLISAEGFMWTASHVVNTAEFVAVKFTDGDVYQAKVISTNPTADVALLKIETGFELKNKHVAIIGNSDAILVGEDIFVIGAPHGLEQTLSRGIVSGRLRPENAGDEFLPVEFIQTDAAINPGNSGGPMFNMKGEVIGIASFILSESGGFNGIGFGASSNVAEKILMHGNQYWTGMEAIFINAELANVFNLPQEAGVLILSVSSKGLGSKVGLRGGYINAKIEGVDLLIGGDILLSVAGIKVENEHSGLKIREKLMTLKKDEKFSLQFFRNGKIFTEFETIK